MNSISPDRGLREKCKPACEHVVQEWLAALGYIHLDPNPTNPPSGPHAPASCTVDAITIGGQNILTQVHHCVSDGIPGLGGTYDTFNDAVWNDIKYNVTTPWDFTIGDVNEKLLTSPGSVGAEANGLPVVFHISNIVGSINIDATVVGALQAGLPEIIEERVCEPGEEPINKGDCPKKTCTGEGDSENVAYHDKIAKKSSDVVYKDMISRRYGVKTNGPDNSEKWKLRMELNNFNALADIDAECTCCMTGCIECAGCTECNSCE